MLLSTVLLILSLLALSIGFFGGYYVQQRQMLKLLSWKELFYTTFFPMKDGVEVNETYVSISYMYGSRRYKVYLPYSPLAALNQYTALLQEEGRESDVSQQPGVKYCVSAEDLGGREIRIDGENGVYTFKGSDIPDNF